MTDKDKLRAAIHAHALVHASRERPIAEGLRLTQRGGWLFDMRAVFLQPEYLNAYAEVFWDRFKDKLPFQVGGIETAGIALVTAIIMKGHERGTPFNGFFVRKSRKR